MALEKIKVKKDSRQNLLTKTVKLDTGFSIFIEASHFTPDEVQWYQAPQTAYTDANQYSSIRLANGLTGLLVSYRDNIEVDSVYKDSRSPPLGSVPPRAYRIKTKFESGQLKTSSVSDRSVFIGPVSHEDVAACCLAVNVGYFHDPDDIPGLAHLSEHLVIKDSDFRKSAHNVYESTLAITDAEFTFFHFDCLVENLPKMLDKFSKMFISSTINKHSMKIEREKLEIQYQEAARCDYGRRDHILASCLGADNPGRKFGWGNRQTLRYDVTDDHLYKSLLMFRETHYSAHRMTVGIQAPVPLKRLEKWIIKYFSRIKRNSKSPQSLPSSTVLCQDDKFHKLYFVKNEYIDSNDLELNWYLPSVTYFYRSKPIKYLSWLISHKNNSSLFAYLEKMNWAEDLIISEDHDGFFCNSLYFIFQIRICLTKKGCDNIRNVIAAVFNYIKMLQTFGSGEGVFKELQNLNMIRFLYGKGLYALDNVKLLSKNMLYYPPNEYITASELLFEYKPEELNEFLYSLSPSSVNIMFSRKRHAGDIQLDQVEKWFKTKYKCVDIPKKWIDSWATVIPHPWFSPPKQNKFIKSDFALLFKKTYPEKIHTSDDLSIWYKKDTTFAFMGFIGLQIVSKNVFNSLLENALLHLYADILNHLLAEKHSTDMKELEFNIMVINNNLLVEISGFSNQLQIFLEKIAQHILEFNKMINEELLVLFKEVKRKEFFKNNQDIRNLTNEICLNILLGVYFSSTEIYNVIPKINLKLMKTFSENFFKHVYVQCLVQGDILKVDALSISKKFAEKLSLGGLSEQDKPQLFVNELPNTEKCCRIKSFNLSDSKCIITNYYQLGLGNARDYCTVQLLEVLIREPLKSFFEHLKMKENLEWDVSSSLQDTFGVLGFTVTVSTSGHTHCTLDYFEEKITEFLHRFKHYVKEIPFSEFKEALDNLKVFKQSYSNLQEKAQTNWGEIKNFNYEFERFESEIEVLSTLRQIDISQFVARCITPGQQYFKKLTIQILGNSSQTEGNEMSPLNSEDLEYTYITEVEDCILHYVHNGQYFIKDINEFKSQLQIYV